MPFPFVKRSQVDELEKKNAELKTNIAILATKLHAIQVICDKHNQAKMGNLRMTRMVKEVVDKI